MLRNIISPKFRRACPLCARSILFAHRAARKYSRGSLLSARITMQIPDLL